MVRSPLKPTETHQRRRLCVRAIASKHTERRLSSSSSLGWHCVPLPSVAAPCCSSEFLQVSITHPKHLTRFSYKGRFTMISKFRAGMNDTCYPGVSARTRRNTPSSSHWYPNQFRQDIPALSLQSLVTSQTWDIQKRGRHRAQVHRGSRTMVSIHS